MVLTCAPIPTQILPRPGHEKELNLERLVAHQGNEDVDHEGRHSQVQTNFNR